MGEMCYVYVRRNTINNTLKEIGSKILDGYVFEYTSTIRGYSSSTSYVWCANPVSTTNRSEFKISVRAFLRF